MKYEGMYQSSYVSGGVEVPRATKDKVIAHWVSNVDLLGTAQLLLSLPSLF
jgi:hypothetical protein